MSRAEAPAWIVGFAGLGVASLGWFLDPHSFHGAWLAAIAVFSGWPLGSLALLLAHALTGGRWGEAIRPALRLGIGAMPLLVPALAPLILGLPSLYAWARPEGAHLANHLYLNVPFFAARGAFYLIAWLGLAALILRGADPARVAPVGLVLLAFTVTFAAIDTTMSLDPRFSSSVYGMIAASGMALLALSAAVLLTGRDAPPDVLPDLGKLLLSLVVLWTYLDFMQLLIVWQSDLAHEAPWYLDRSRGFYGALRAAIAIGHFALPFFLLLSPRMQRRRGVVMGVAALLVLMEILRGWWTVLPSLGRGIGWIDVAAMAALGGLGLGVGLRTRRAAGWRLGHV